MAALAGRDVGVPVRLLHEAEGHNVTIELKSGEVYRGHLETAEDTMNVQLTGVAHTARDELGNLGAKIEDKDFLVGHVSLEN